MRPLVANYFWVAKRSIIAGFTIIEVLIVLAVAGLILLIVFLAVPALQRNSRNTGRKEDIGRLASGVNDYVSSNAGAFPLQANWTTATTGGCAVIESDAGTLNQYVGLTCQSGANSASISGFYESNIGIVTGAANPTVNEVVLSESAQCNGTNATGIATGRAAALLYTLETGSGWTWACQNIQ